MKLASNFNKDESDVRRYIITLWRAFHVFSQTTTNHVVDFSTATGANTSARTRRDAWRRRFRKSWIRETISLVSAALPGNVVGVSILSHNGVAATVVSRVVHMRKTGGRGVTVRRVLSPTSTNDIIIVGKIFRRVVAKWSRTHAYTHICMYLYNERGTTWLRPV